MSKDLSSICFQEYFGVAICNLKSRGNAYERCKETLKPGFRVWAIGKAKFYNPKYIFKMGYQGETRC
jgi:hypothetical protein